jgi:hypothetical protein
MRFPLSAAGNSSSSCFASICNAGAVVAVVVVVVVVDAVEAWWGRPSATLRGTLRLALGDLIVIGQPRC